MAWTNTCGPTKLSGLLEPIRGLVLVLVLGVRRVRGRPDHWGHWCPEERLHPGYGKNGLLRPSGAGLWARGSHLRSLRVIGGLEP